MNEWKMFVCRAGRRIIFSTIATGFFPWSGIKKSSLLFCGVSLFNIRTGTSRIKTGILDAPEIYTIVLPG